MQALTGREPANHSMRGATDPGDGPHAAQPSPPDPDATLVEATLSDGTRLRGWLFCPPIRGEVIGETRHGGSRRWLRIEGQTTTVWRRLPANAKVRVVAIPGSGGEPSKRQAEAHLGPTDAGVAHRLLFGTPVGSNQP
ncbi:MAG: hypothetical protein AAGB00_00460 [Planctomycetota bacterium]